MNDEPDRKADPFIVFNEIGRAIQTFVPRGREITLVELVEKELQPSFPTQVPTENAATAEAEAQAEAQDFAQRELKRFQTGLERYRLALYTKAIANSEQIETAGAVQTTEDTLAQLISRNLHGKEGTGATKEGTLIVQDLSRYVEKALRTELPSFKLGGGRYA